MAMSDKARGSLMLLTAVLAFLYYTFWTLLLPFFDSDSPIHLWFPAREWAIRIPALIVVVGTSAMGLFLGVRILQDSATATQQHSRRKTI